MHRDRSVCAWIPFGRERTVSILMPYLLADPVIDEIWLCMNTDPDQDSDRRYAAELAEAHDKVSLKLCPGPNTPDLAMPEEWRRDYRFPKQMNTGRFPLYMSDRSAVFVRFDDDIVWVHPDTVRTLVDRVIDRRADTLGVFGLIYNNAICSWLLQQHGRIPKEWGRVGQGVRDGTQVSAVDPIGWQQPRFAEQLHHLVLELLESGRQDDLRLPAELTLGRRQQFSVSCFAISGEEYADLDGVLNWDEEEHWLTMHHTGIVGKSNIVCGMAPVSHFSFFTQREALLETDILERYRALSETFWRNETLGKGYYGELAKVSG